MLTAEQQSDFASLQVELIDLNILAHFYVRKVNRFAHLYRKTTRHYVLEEYTALRYFENGIILHLTNLDDDSSLFSFRSASKVIHKSVRDSKALASLKSEIDQYRKMVNTIKVKHRNSRIAHINSINNLNFDEFMDFESSLKPLILQANKIGDIILGKKLHYKFKLGSLEGILDFRNLVENATIDGESETGFI